MEITYGRSWECEDCGILAKERTITAARAAEEAHQVSPEHVAATKRGYRALGWVTLALTLTCVILLTAVVLGWAR